MGKSGKLSFSFKHNQKFYQTKKYMQRMKQKDWHRLLGRYGEKGVELLRSATPRVSGLTADSWEYEIVETGRKSYQIVWHNTNVKSGYFNVAVGIQYGHGTRGGGYVTGIDYINPAIKTAFVELAADIWREVSNQ